MSNLLISKPKKLIRSQNCVTGDSSMLLKKTYNSCNILCKAFHTSLQFLSNFGKTAYWKSWLPLKVKLTKINIWYKMMNQQNKLITVPAQSITEWWPIGTVAQMQNEFSANTALKSAVAPLHNMYIYSA